MGDGMQMDAHTESVHEAPRSLSNSALLRRKITLYSQHLYKEADRFWNHSGFASVYRAYLCNNHAVIRATVPLMRAAIESLRAPKFADDPVTRPMMRYLEQHAEEETGHDEWILDDAEVMGVPRNEVLGIRPSQTVTHIVGAQYYSIYHHHPVALLGYIAVMEGEPGAAEFYEEVARRNELPREAFSSMLYHAKIDPVHKADLDRLLDRLDLDQHKTELIGLSALRTIDHLTTIIRDINESAPERS